MPWIEAHSELGNHPKSHELAGAMGWDIDQTIGKLFRLWWWCLSYAPDGDLRKFNDVTIASAMGVAVADGKRLVEALVQSCWVEREPYFRIHDWWIYSRYYLRSRFKNQPAKWRKVQELYAGTDSTIQDVQEDRLEDGQENRPENGLTPSVGIGQPNQTKPNQTQRAALEGSGTVEGKPVPAAPPQEFAEIPTKAEVIAFGNGPAGIPAAYCAEYWQKKEIQKTWLNGFGRLIDWKKQIVSFWASDRAQWPRKGPGVTVTGKPRKSLAQQELEQLERAAGVAHTDPETSQILPPHLT